MNSVDAALRRWITFGSGVLFAFFAVIGVTIDRDIGVRHIGVIVPAWWYAVAVVPPGIAALFGLLLPTEHRWWHRKMLFIVLMGLIFLSLLHIPFIYALYDFEHPRATRQATMSHEIGSLISADRL